MNYYKTVLALFLGYVSISQVSADLAKAPVKARINAEVFERVFHKRDQELLKVFGDLALNPGHGEEISDTNRLSDLNASLKPKDGIEFDDFDMELHLEKDYLGAQSSELQYEGTGKVDGEEFSFKGPVNMFKLQYEMTDKFNKDLNFDQLLFEEKEFLFDTPSDKITITGADLSAEEKELILSRLHYQITSIKDTTSAGKVESIPSFPVDTVIPFVVLYYAASFADSYEKTEKFVELGFSFNRMKLLTPKQEKLLKPIEGHYYNEVNAQGQEALTQLIIDDNFFNSFTSILASLDKTLSMRTILKGNPKAKAVLDMLTTSTIGTVLPEFINEYGENKRVDLVLTPSHAMFQEGIPNSRMSGVYMDKNGNWKFIVNLNALVNVETLPDMWDPIRNIYITLVAKLKLSTDATNPFNKVFKFLPKTIEMSQIKVLKGDEEQTSEQMMIQSMVNIQFEQAKKMFKEIPIPVGDILKKNPPELQCFGFNVADLGVDFKKSQVQISTYYKNMNNPDKDICDNFLQQLLKSPQALLDKIKKSTNIGAIQKGLEEYRTTTPEMAKEKLQAEARKMRAEQEKRFDEDSKANKEHEERVKQAKAVREKKAKMDREAKEKAEKHEDL